MYKKLISNLPFNPSLINQVAFYAKRLHKEERLRRTGLILVALSMVVQVFAYVSPTEASLQSSGNDIIPGGFQTQDQAVLHCLNNKIDFNAILKYYGIGCDTLARAETVTLKSTDYERKMHSLGRWPQGQTIESTGKPTGEYEVKIDGAHTRLFMRNLWAWDSGAYSTYKFLRMKNSQGLIVMVMFNCGNIVTVGQFPTPTAPAPAPEAPKKPELIIKKETSTNEMVSVGDDITYSLLYRNKGNATASNVTIKDYAPNNTNLVSVQPGGNAYKLLTNERGVEFWPKVTNKVLGYSDFYHVVKITVRVTRYPSDGNKICNTAQIISDQGEVTSNEVCNYVRKPATTTTPDSPRTPTIIPDLPAPVTPETPTSPALTTSKKARNETQNIADANNTKAQPGDTIRYTLSVKNTGTGKASAYIFRESLGDVLEYADVVSLDGGTLNDKKEASWSAVDIAPGQTVTKDVTVRVKNPLPGTPTPPSHPGSFDLIMTNVFENNAVNIGLPGSTIKQAEQVSGSLPKTGPGEVLAVGVGVTVFASYFFARSRLLAKELDIVREEAVVSGGV